MVHRRAVPPRAQVAALQAAPALRLLHRRRGGAEPARLAGSACRAQRRLRGAEAAGATSDSAARRSGISSSAARMPPDLNKKPAIAPPISGATMKSHTWPSAAGLVPAPTSAGPSERAGLSEVPVILSPHK